MRRETGTYLSPGSRRYGKHWVPQIFTKRIGSPVQSSECSPLAKLPTWAARWVSSGCPQDPGRSLGLSCLPTLDLVLNLFPLPASSPPLLIFPMAPMCLSAGITLTNAFTHFPQKSALQAAAPLVLEAKTLQRHPRQGEEEILARSPVARGRGASLGYPSARVSCALLTLVSRDQSRSLGYPEAEALAYLHQEGSRLRSWFQKTPQGDPQTQKDLKRRPRT